MRGAVRKWNAVAHVSSEVWLADVLVRQGGNMVRVVFFVLLTCRVCDQRRNRRGSASSTSRSHAAADDATGGWVASWRVAD
jgi:hypothetical protein